MVKLVIFDWNGTLLSDTAYAFGGANKVLESIGGKRISLKHYRETANIPVIKFYLAHGLSEEQFYKLAPKNTKIFEEFYESRAAKARTRTGARQVLRWLDDHKISSAILSNHSKEGIEVQLRRLKLGGFEEILANTNLNEALTQGKGDKVRHYLRKKKIQPSKVLLIGDSPEDIEIAKSIGATSVALREGAYSTKRLIQSKPDYIIGSLKELIEIVDAINKGIV